MMQWFQHRVMVALSLITLIFSIGGSDLAAQDPFELGGFDGFGGDDNPVSFSATDVKAASPGSDVVGTVVAKIERGWHIYSFDMDPELGIPTTMYVVSCGDLQMPGAIQEPTPHEREAALVGGGAHEEVSGEGGHDTDAASHSRQHRGCG